MWSCYLCIYLIKYSESTGRPWEYNLRVAPDNMGMPICGKHCGHFHFYVTGGNMSIGTVLKFHLLNVSPHSSLYKFDMRPVVRCNATNQKWVRLKQSVQFNKADDLGQLHFQYVVERDKDKVYFCFTYPYTYEMVQNDMLQLDILSASINYNDKNSIYCNREVITKTPDGRNIDYITISSCDGINMYAREEVLPGLFPEENALISKDIAHTAANGNSANSTAVNGDIVGASDVRPTSKKASKKHIDCNELHQANMKQIRESGKVVKRPYTFPTKEIAFISARVHPGEVPAQHTFKGILDFLLHPTDIRAIELRKRYVFKLIPMLNPDGVYRGHFRMDQFHQNLNRYYTSPDPVYQPSIFAVKTVLDFYALRLEKLVFYLDLHAHASKRGCFIYGNVINDIEDQLQNQLLCSLIALNTPHFDYSGCLFSREHMTRIDPCDQAKGLTAEGSGRVAIYLAYGLIHSYTLECNYNMSKYTNEICALNNAHLLGCEDPTPQVPYNQLNNEKYTPHSYACVGRACLIALLDIRKHNPCSRLINSNAKTLERLRDILLNEIKQRKEYRGLAFKRKPKSIKTSQSEKGNKTNGVSGAGGAHLIREMEDAKWKRITDSLPNGAIVIKEGKKNSSGGSKVTAVTTGTTNALLNNSKSTATNATPSRPEVEKSSSVSFNGRKMSTTSCNIGTSSTAPHRNPSDGMLLVLDNADQMQKDVCKKGNSVMKPLHSPICSPIAARKKELERDQNDNSNALHGFLISGTNPLASSNSNIILSNSAPNTAHGEMLHKSPSFSSNHCPSSNSNPISNSLRKSHKDLKKALSPTTVGAALGGSGKHSIRKTNLTPIDLNMKLMNDSLPSISLTSNANVSPPQSISNEESKLFPPLNNCSFSSASPHPTTSDSNVIIND